tara:strand:+ start:830 stop:1057 length:228 start_codon:yes stop_codon:yes gene_type:complete
MPILRISNQSLSEYISERRGFDTAQELVLALDRDVRLGTETLARRVGINFGDYKAANPEERIELAQTYIDRTSRR